MTFNPADLVYPTKRPQLWTPVIGGTVIPWRVVHARAHSFAKKVKVEGKEHLDISFATITTKGYELLEWKIDMTAHNEAGMVLLYVWAEKLLPTVKSFKDEGLASGIQPLQIYHPTLDLYGVDKFIPVELEGPEYEDQKHKLTVHCMQWAKPPSATKKSETKTPIDAKPTALGPDPKTGRDMPMEAARKPAPVPPGEQSVNTSDLAAEKKKFKRS